MHARIYFKRRYLSNEGNEGICLTELLQKNLWVILTLAFLTENNVKYNVYDLKVLTLSYFYLNLVYKADLNYKNGD